MGKPPPDAVLPDMEKAFVGLMAAAAGLGIDSFAWEYRVARAGWRLGIHMGSAPLSIMLGQAHGRSRSQASQTILLLEPGQSVIVGNVVVRRERCTYYSRTN